MSRDEAPNSLAELNECIPGETRAIMELGIGGIGLGDHDLTEDANLELRYVDKEGSKIYERVVLSQLGGPVEKEAIEQLLRIAMAQSIRSARP